MDEYIRIIQEKFKQQEEARVELEREVPSIILQLILFYLRPTLNSITILIFCSRNILMFIIMSLIYSIPLLFWTASLSCLFSSYTSKFGATDNAWQFEMLLLFLILIIFTYLKKIRKDTCDLPLVCSSIFSVKESDCRLFD